jgi:serine/threonine protein phosphatase 1
MFHKRVMPGQIRAGTMSRRRPRVPDGLRIYAVGDVHGRADLLATLAGLVEQDARGIATSCVTVFLGDYIDRGPASFDVVERLAAGAWPTPVVGLLGNHEDVCLAFLEDPVAAAGWRHYGALPTLASYGIDVNDAVAAFLNEARLPRLRDSFRAALPARHLEFLRQLRTCTAAGDYFFCHAGVRPGVPLTAQETGDLIAIRDLFLGSDADFGKIVVHGHTPTEEVEIRSNRIGLDTRAYATGRLSALVLEGEERAVITTMG